MRLQKNILQFSLFPLIFASTTLSANSEANKEQQDVKKDDGIPTVVVVDKRRSFEVPATITQTPISQLRYNPEIDLQSRGLAETQSDISVRGGLFESTGVKIGAVTIFDPQTGHYTAELPLDSFSLESPTLLTSIDNVSQGFNSTVATIAYNLAPIERNRELSIGLGTDAFRESALRIADTWELDQNNTLATSASFSQSQGDGSRANGDHDLKRGSLHTQLKRADSQSDLLLAYQDKFFGWPGMYTGFASLAETDHTQSGLAIVNHKQQLAQDNWFEIGGFYRELDDDYDFNRSTTECCQPGSFDHQTKSYALGLRGEHSLNTYWDLNYSAQFSADRLVRSTDLLGGSFNSRRYTKLSLLPSRTWQSNTGVEWQVQAGLSFDSSDRDENELLPALGLSRTSHTANSEHTFALNYASSSQLPGYTVLGSGVSGLFGGNPELGRERSDDITITYQNISALSAKSVTAFYRQDDELVDWTFSSASPFVRQANAVDINVSGVQLAWQRNYESFDLNLGYQWLDKDADYGNMIIDASYYALNYAKQRFTANTVWHIRSGLDLHLDMQARKQAKNVLRTTSDDAFEAAAALSWQPAALDGLHLDLIVDNITNSNFQHFPGALSTRRSASIKASYQW